MRPTRTLVGLAVAGLAAAAGLLAGCGERAAPGVTIRDAAASTEPTVTATPSTTPDGSATPSPAAAPAGAIPDGLAVGDGLPEADGDFRHHDHGVSVELCGREVFPVDDLADRRTASVTGPEYGEARDLRLFPGVTAAEEFVADVADRFRACPGSEHAGSESTHDLVRSTLEGDESFTAVQTYLFDGRPTLGANFWEVVRVGPAVLLTASYGEYDPQRNLDQGIREHAASIAGIVEQLCVFADSPCPAK